MASGIVGGFTNPLFVWLMTTVGGVWFFLFLVRRRHGDDDWWSGGLVLAAEPDSPVPARAHRQPRLGREDDRTQDGGLHAGGAQGAPGVRHAAGEGGGAGEDRLSPRQGELQA